MFYQLIENKRDKWLASKDCTINELLHYIEQRGMMRDAQIEAIKTYLFLKIACNNQPLWQLFVDGVFNDIDLEKIELTAKTREIFTSNKAAVALFQYSLLRDKNDNQLSPKLEKYIKQHADEIDYEEIFKKLFYGVRYTDYLFSLPMGAGKTYLMAAFIYLDLYFAQNDPDNPAFAHNFMVMAPSGLKSSIVPSLKHIKEFDPSWIIPEPTATQLRKIIKFEILDEQKTVNKSNRVKNPNAQKINNHQPLSDLMGLVAITNAEKVILDHYDESLMPLFVSQKEYYTVACANELRDIIGRIPHLAIFIDEVHHAAAGDIKLRRVVNKWSRLHNFNSIIGFSGTPYLERAEPVIFSESFSVKNTNLTNVVYYYPLIDGIGNFLKSPEVKFTDSDTEAIVTNGVKDFFEKYRDTIYENGTCAKMAIYCGQIETLEETIYPLVSEIAASYGLNPTETILPYHGGNKQYPQHEGSEAAFASLDTSVSKFKIILLVQIGKEGWDCKSLTGVILPQKGACPMNMVLQTSCRCLRQVIKFSQETALIWLNKYNADILNNQLQQLQNITLQEFSGKPSSGSKMIERFSRMEYLHVPPIDFYQLKVSYETLLVDDSNNPAKRLKRKSLLVKQDSSLIHQQNMEGQEIKTYEQEQETKLAPSFHWWLHQIAKESFGKIGVSDLKKYEVELKKIYTKITVKKEGTILEKVEYDHQRIRSLIRQAYFPIREFKVKEEIVPAQANLLQIEKLISPIENCDKFYPDPKTVNEIVTWDTMPPQQELTPVQKAKIDELEAMGIDVSALRNPKPDPHPERSQTYHYLPYRFDSGLEAQFLSKEIIPIIQDKKLEVYFNGDDTLTEFKINCYSKSGNSWKYIGKYVPDFLLLNRNGQGEIDKIIIIETKGEYFAPKFKDRKEFMETEWIKKNNDKFGYQRFEFLYLEDTLSQEQRMQITLHAIKNFFNV